jgi:hypothetical protein
MSEIPATKDTWSRTSGGLSIGVGVLGLVKKGVWNEMLGLQAQFFHRFFAERRPQPIQLLRECFKPRDVNTRQQSNLCGSSQLVETLLQPLDYTFQCRYCTFVLGLLILLANCAKSQTE